MKTERTLVLIKPDGVERGLVGQILSRFEQVGLKLIGLRLLRVDEEFASRHYTEDIAKRRGQHIRDLMIEMLSTGPVVAMVLEGIEAIELVRKMVGPTEPKAAAPGTIRGDFAHMSYSWGDTHKVGIKNVIHASSSGEDAASEISLWFAESDLVEYQTVYQHHIEGR